MDISSLTNYTDYLQNTASANSLGTTIKTTNYSGSTDEEMLEACKQFESYFVEQMFKEMQKTVDVFKDKDGIDGSTNSMMDYFRDEYFQKLASTNTEKGGFGLAQTLYEQMKRNYEVQEVIVNDQGVAKVDSDSENE